MKTHRSTQIEIRAKAAKRRKRVASLKKQGMPQRQIARELGCNEKTVRSDLQALRLAAEHDAATGCENTEKPPFAGLIKAGMPHLQHAADTNVKQKRTTPGTQQVLPDELATHNESNTLAAHILNWSLNKKLSVRDEFDIFSAVEPFTMAPRERGVTASEGPEAVFESIERGRLVPSQKTEALKYYAEVLVEALPRLAPDPETRDWAIQKAIAEVVMFIRYPEGLPRGTL